MILYHGSNMEIKAPKLIKSKRLLDFGIGPVANDQAIRTVNNYLKGYLTADIAIQLLLPQNLKDQYVFKTEKALSILQFNEVKYL